VSWATPPLARSVIESPPQAHDADGPLATILGSVDAVVQLRYRPAFMGWPACHPSQNRQWYGMTVPPHRRTMSRAAARASQREVNRTLPRHDRCSNQVAARFPMADATTTPSTISVPFPFRRSRSTSYEGNLGLACVTLDVTSGAAAHRELNRRLPRRSVRSGFAVVEGLTSTRTSWDLRQDIHPEPRRRRHYRFHGRVVLDQIGL